MSTAVQFAKKVLGIDPQQGVEPLAELECIGSTYHGYTIPRHFLTAESICYCIGAGDDISFDTELKVRFDANVFIFDPMPEGVLHYKKLVDYAQRRQPLTIHPNHPFTYRITADQLAAIRLVETGVWDHKGTVKFYEPTRNDYPSHSIYLFKESGNYIEAPVDRLANIMNDLGHTALDLVKIEIEGAEYTVIDTILDDKLDVKLILVEFDEVHNATDKLFHYRIRKTCSRLKKAGYVLIHSTSSMKRSFLRRDIFDQLNGR